MPFLPNCLISGSIPAYNGSIIIMKKYYREKIYFTLKTDIPPRLIGQYDGRSAEIGIAIVPAVMEAHKNGKVFLFEEEVSLAEDYLRAVLIVWENQLGSYL